MPTKPASSSVLTPRVIFVGTQFREVEYWMRAWGFRRPEVYWVGRVEHTYGIRGADHETPVYVCGSAALNPDLVPLLEIAGFNTFIDAHDVDTNREPESALGLLLDQLRPRRLP